MPTQQDSFQLQQVHAGDFSAFKTCYYSIAAILSTSHNTPLWPGPSMLLVVVMADHRPANSHHLSVRLQILGAFSRSHCGPTKSHYNCCFPRLLRFRSLATSMETLSSLQVKLANHDTCVQWEPEKN